MDDYAPYSTIGETKLLFHQKSLARCKVSLDSKPVQLALCEFWQFGSGNHASPGRQILGSVVQNLVTDSPNPISVSRIAIKVSSQWILSRKITRRCCIIHLDRHSLDLSYNESEYIFHFVTINTGMLL